LKCKGQQQLLFLLAVCERLKAHLGGVAESLITEWQPVATALGKHLGLDHSQTAIFGEEVPLELCQHISPLAPCIAFQYRPLLLNAKKPVPRNKDLKIHFPTHPFIPSSLSFPFLSSPFLGDGFTNLSAFGYAAHMRQSSQVDLCKTLDLW
jgi:hypothetical protein